MMSGSAPPKRIVIAGGGTAGWMTAAAVAKTLGGVAHVTLIESDAIGTIGVGESTIPPLVKFNQILDINEADFMRATKATFKVGINFEGWKEIDHVYFHSFGLTGRDHWTSGFQHFWLRAAHEGLAADYGAYCLEVAAAQAQKFAQLPDYAMNYSFHIDAGLYAKFLRQIAEKNGAERIEGRIENVTLHPETGMIQSLTLDAGRSIAGDIFVDCTGFRALLIGKALGVGYIDWSKYLPCDSAIAVQTRSTRPPPPYTRAMAHDAGWQWRIPLQHRTGNGIVYCSAFLDKDDALQRLLSGLEGETLIQPNFIRFQAGVREQQWRKNCVAIGLSSGFLEPLESTSIHLIQRSVLRLLRMMPLGDVSPADVDEFNDQADTDMWQIRDFIILHYVATHRNDSAFWNQCRSMEVPDTLRHKIDLFRQTGRVFRKNEELFAENSWVQVMLGQGVMPETYHPIANKMSSDELTKFLGMIQANVSRTVERLPPHEAYVRQYCGADDS
ncbi:MAG TPA: tryptophan halogenase family protein [Caulobacterales bacterium]|nr:tryptophan halogenase family protein [Caulobacterales bacterium]